MKKGKCIIFSAPSGAGKTTIVHYLLKQIPELSFSISACSREPRINEINGKDYYFLGIENFKLKIDGEEFVEWQEVYENNFYGTLHSELIRIWEEEKIVIFDVDVIGGINLKKYFGDQALSVFVQPPSIKDLEKRLRFRSTETEEKIVIRLAKAEEELSKSTEFDLVVVNDDLEKACEFALEKIKYFISK